MEMLAYETVAKEAERKGTGRPKRLQGPAGRVES